MKKISELVKEKPWFGWLLYIFTILIVFLIGLLASNIIERRTEANLVQQVVTPINEWEPRNEVWGQNYPREFETYKNTLDTTFASKHGGSVTIDMLARYPNLVILWAGYAFSREYNQGRGHYWAVNDVRKTLRTDVPQPSTCWTCKSTDVPRMMNKIGIANFYKTPWKEMGSEIINPIGCQDCHDPKTMNLRITRPALIEAFQRQGKNITQSTHQEMRTLVCAQCHVEYYFKGKEEKYLTFPWDKGFTVDDAEKYYDEYDFTDWVNPISKAPMIKAQHPDYELFRMGIHNQRGVSCADCHMPYKSEGNVKFTNHKIQSPLANVSSSCVVCHRVKESELIENVYERQDKIFELEGIATNNLVNAHIYAKACWDAGATEEQMKPILLLIRHSQWRWDYVAASHGGSFHAPLECARILGTSIEKSQKAIGLEIEILTKMGKQPPLIPAFTTKEEAQQYIGLDMPKIFHSKDEFIKTMLPQWDKTGEERQGKLQNSYK